MLPMLEVVTQAHNDLPHVYALFVSRVIALMFALFAVHTAIVRRRVLALVGVLGAALVYLTLVISWNQPNRAALVNIASNVFLSIIFASMSREGRNRAERKQ